jgi:hypothetical protein
MQLADDQKVIKALAPHRADETSGERVRPWRAYRRLDHPGADVGEHGVELGATRPAMPYHLCHMCRTVWHRSRTTP